MNNNDESTDEEIDENEDIPESDTEKDPIVFESNDEEELSFETDSDDFDLDKDSDDLSLDKNYSENDEENISLDKNTSEDKSLKNFLKNKNFKSKQNKSEEIKKNRSSISNINNKNNASNKIQINKQDIYFINKINKSNVSTISKVTQNNKIKNDNNFNLNDIKRSKEKDLEKNIESSISKKINSDKMIKNQIDEYEYDSSDEEDIRNTIGNIPMKWYNDYDHIGYNWDGKKIIKPQKGDQLDNFLKRMEDPDFWRTIKDPQTGQDVKLSEADIDLIIRIQKRKIPDITFDEYSVSILLIRLIIIFIV